MVAYAHRDDVIADMGFLSRLLALESKVMVRMPQSPHAGKSVVWPSISAPFALGTEWNRIWRESLARGNRGMDHATRVRYSRPLTDDDIRAVSMDGAIALSGCSTALSAVRRFLYVHPTIAAALAGLVEDGGVMTGIADDPMYADYLFFHLLSPFTPVREDWRLMTPPRDSVDDVIANMTRSPVISRLPQDSSGSGRNPVDFRLSEVVEGMDDDEAALMLFVGDVRHSIRRVGRFRVVAPERDPSGSVAEVPLDGRGWSPVPGFSVPMLMEGLSRDSYEATTWPPVDPGTLFATTANAIAHRRMLLMVAQEMAHGRGFVEAMGRVEGLGFRWPYPTASAAAVLGLKDRVDFGGVPFPEDCIPHVMHDDESSSLPLTLDDIDRLMDVDMGIAPTASAMRSVLSAVFDSGSDSGLDALSRRMADELALEGAERRNGRWPGGVGVHVVLHRRDGSDGRRNAPVDSHWHYHADFMAAATIGDADAIRASIALHGMLMLALSTLEGIESPRCGKFDLRIPWDDVDGLLAMRGQGVPDDMIREAIVSWWNRRGRDS